MSSLDPFARDDAAYVLGALGPGQRRAFEDHLARCPTCTSAVHMLAGVPGLLGRLPESAFTDAEATPAAAPEDLLPQLLLRVRRQRRRSRVLAVAGTAVAAVLAALLGLSLQGGDTPGGSPATARHMTQVDQDQLTATVELEQVAWGTRLRLDCTYEADEWAEEWSEEPPPPYALVVHTREGASERVATWRAVPGRTVAIEAATEVSRPDIVSVEVVTVGSGRRLLTLRARGS